MLTITQLPVLSDNYIYLIHNEETKEAAVIDPAKAESVLDFLEQNKLELRYILNTHHHWDHVGGNLELQSQTDCQIIGYKNDVKRIPGINQYVDDEHHINILGSNAEVFFVPGHTLGHIAYYFPQENALFCGDTIFMMGCGRLFEGSPKQMHASLTKLAALPDNTQLYCAHEYTLNNAEFALTIEPDNQALQQRYKEIQKLREHNTPTVPGDLATERATNPFLRTNSPEIRRNLDMEHANDVEVFAEIRRRKDNF